jgi:hypothetical protein
MERTRPSLSRAAIAAAAHARPFRPFTIHTRDGRPARVSHPEVIFFPPKNPQMLAIAKPKGGVRLLFLPSITALEQEAADAPRQAQ